MTRAWVGLTIPPVNSVTVKMECTTLDLHSVSAVTQHAPLVLLLQPVLHAPTAVIEYWMPVRRSVNVHKDSTMQVLFSAVLVLLGVSLAMHLGVKSVTLLQGTL